MERQPKVFLSYRRADSAVATGRIYDRLAARFGDRIIFKDIESIPVAADFQAYIDAVISQSSAVLALIGPRWASMSHPDGERRLDDANDPVRVEVETAFRTGIVVLPVLVDGATMPQASELPVSLAPLARLNGLSVRHDPDFDGDIERLAQALRRIDPCLARFDAAPPPGILVLQARRNRRVRA